MLHKGRIIKKYNLLVASLKIEIVTKFESFTANWICLETI